jgi:hypothetical protein
MQTIALDQLSELNWADASDSQCFKVLDPDGNIAMIAVTRPMEAMKFRIEAICSQIDAGRDRPPLDTKTPITAKDILTKQLAEIAGSEQYSA